MAVGVVNLEMARFLIRRDTNTIRFQQFCVELISAAEQVTYVSSAMSHDLGRDGRTSLTSIGDINGVVCSSVKLDAKDAVGKAKNDLERLAETGLPTRIALCFTCELQEEHKEKIMAHARAIAPGCKVRAEGVEYLSQAAERYQDVIEKHYHGELLTLRHSLLADSSGMTPTAAGLRIAIATQFGESASALRISAMTNLLRLTLVNKGWTPRQALRDQISSELGLGQPVNAAYLDGSVAELEKLQELETQGQHVRLTPVGVAAANALLADARKRLLDGRQVFLEELNQRLSTAPIEARFDQLWIRLQDGLSGLFMHEGMSVVRAILDPALGDQHAASASIFSTLAQNIDPHPPSRSEGLKLAESVIDILCGETKTREWLSQIAATFLSICALGLHPDAQEQLLKRLLHWSLLVDTHVVISKLCNAEDDHEAVLRVMEAWQKLGREIASCEAVLEEAAYHAHIAKKCYDEHEHELSQMTRDAARQLIPNAFLRSFHQISAGTSLSRSRWNAFIANFCGKNEYDGTKLQKYLVDEKWTILCDSAVDLKVVRKLQRKLSADGTLPDVRLSKSGTVWEQRRLLWDARTALIAVDRAKRLTDTDGKVIIVTKSGAIRKAVQLLEHGSPAKVSVMTVSAIGYAIALTPGLSVSLVHIRELLFDRSRLAQAFGQLSDAARRIADRDREEGLDLAGGPQLRDRIDGAVTEEMDRIEKSNLHVSKTVRRSNSKRRTMQGHAE